MDGADVLWSICLPPEKLVVLGLLRGDCVSPNEDRSVPQYFCFVVFLSI